MGYGPPSGLLVRRLLTAGYVVPAASMAGADLPNGDAYVLGTGYLSGTYPAGITKIEGVPGPAEIRVLLRPVAGGMGDGMLVATVVSGVDGTWRVDGLNTALRFDVVCRQDGYNDMILSNVAPKPA